MNTRTLLLAVLLGLTCHVVCAQETKVDWEAEYKQLLESDPGVLKKIEAGQATKEDVIQWLQQTRREKTKSVKKEPAKKTGKRDLSAFRKKLGEFVKSGKLSQAEATKLFATMRSEKTSQEDVKDKDAVDWDAEYEKLLKDPAARQKIENGGATKEQVINFLKQKRGVKGGKGKPKGAMKGKAKAGARKGSVNFYAIVVGKLKSKDIELGELEIEIDYIHSQSDWAKNELIGQRVKLVGVAGAFLDNLLRIKRGETIKVRTGDYNRETKVLGFGYKFQVLERTAPFKPEDFGVPPDDFRGFHGELVGKVVEAQGYEVLLDVQKSKPADGSKAKDADSIIGKRIRIAGFYDQHADAFADLHEGDEIRVSVSHRNAKSDSLNVTDVLKRVDDGEKAASAAPVHTPTKMQIAKAESVGMSTEGLNRIDNVMQQHIDAGRIQGAVTVVARRGKVVHFSTHGEMDVRTGRAMEPDAIFRMASSTKPVIGVATMMMIDEGLISPSDPVSKYIPEFANMKVAVLAEPAVPKQKTKARPTETQKQKKFSKFKKEVPKHRLVPVDTPITIHHLLTHTSGLMSGGLGAASNPLKRTKDDTLASYTAKLAMVPLDFQPGTQWAYGNAGIHAVLPRIVEIVSKTPFEKFVRERVLNPLEMHNSYFDLPSEKESKRVVVLYKGRVVKKGKGGMGLSSSAEDFLHFQQMLLNRGEFFGHRLLRPASVAMMSSNQVGDLFATSRKGQKGMGFGYTVAVTLDPNEAGNSRGKDAFGWGGAGGTMSWTDPENELVAVIMLQQPRGSMQRDFANAIQEAIIE